MCLNFRLVSKLRLVSLTSPSLRCRSPRIKVEKYNQNILPSIEFDAASFCAQNVPLSPRDNACRVYQRRAGASQEATSSSWEDRIIVMPVSRLNRQVEEHSLPLAGLRVAAPPGEESNVRATREPINDRPSFAERLLRYP